MENLGFQMRAYLSCSGPEYTNTQEVKKVPEQPDYQNTTTLPDIPDYQNSEVLEKKKKSTLKRKTEKKAHGKAIREKTPVPQSEETEDEIDPDEAQARSLSDPPEYQNAQALAPSPGENSLSKIGSEVDVKKELFKSQSGFDLNEEVPEYQNAQEISQSSDLSTTSSNKTPLNNKEKV